jgi:transketolase
MNELEKRCHWVRWETLKIHKNAAETRLASSLSCVEILVALYYGGVLKYDPRNLSWQERDRFIVSKGHGSISLYPILADRGFFDLGELENATKKGSFLGGIPDCIIPGYETTNGSLGHGPGVACGLAVGLLVKENHSNVVVMTGDAELYEGSVWEAIMFAGHHRLDNLLMIVDANKIAMLDYCRKIINLEPLAEKFSVFGWQVEEIDGHDVQRCVQSLKSLMSRRDGRPKVLIAHTIKGKGVAKFENDSLCHIKNMTPQEVDEWPKQNP